MVKRLLFISLLIFAILPSSGQKSRVLSVFQMIESEKFEEAKEAIELAVWNDKTAKWHRTYYAKGLLCQKAFESGFEKNETKKVNLYPKQLIVGYKAYEKALELDSRDRISSTITLQYYALANDFQKLGERHYLKKEYSQALEAFEHALLVSKSPLLSVETDTNLVYNAAVSAFESKNWEKAISYLTGLNDDGYSSNTALLLYQAHVKNGGAQLGEEVLFEALKKYNSDEVIVMQSVDLLVETNRIGKAIEMLDTASVHQPENFRFPWTSGLLYLRMNLYDEAIESLTVAGGLAPGEVGICYNLGLCYYNRGVEINEAAQKISVNVEYQAARRSAMEQFSEAVNWLEKAHELDPGDQQTILKLYQLYYWLQMTEKQKSIELLIR